MIKTPQTPTLPKDFQEGEDVGLYLQSLRKAIEVIFQHVYQDFLNGNSQLKVVTIIPTVDTLDEGELAIYVTGTTFQLYTNVSGVLKTLG